MATHTIPPWASEVAGRCILAGIRYKDLAKRAGLNDKYLSQLMHGHVVSDNARLKVFRALDVMEAEARA